ncbi:MAG: ABC transporter ATP-binding protein [Acetatifactor sp.]
MIELKDVHKKYKDFCLNVSMEVRPGCVTGLIGKNGAGKSTTFKAILGLIQPDSGEARVMGKPADELTAADKKKIGVTLAESGFSSYFSVKDIVAVLKRMYENFDKTAFLEQCRKFDLPLDKRLSEFSTGMKAKLKVLIAISHGASLLILDEPTAGLDVMARNELLDMLRDYMAEDESRSILISSHISSDLEGLCDDLYLIEQGKMVLHEETDVLLSDYGVLKVNEAQFEKLDRRYLLCWKKEAFGYQCLTKERQYYLENYPGIVVEKSNIDDVLVLMTGGIRA